MSTATATLDHELQINGRLTVDSFCKLAEELASRHGAANDMPELLRKWRESNHDAAELKAGIELALTSLRRSLMQWQIRFDGNSEHLQRTLELLKSDTVVKHAEDTKLAHLLVNWCKAYPEIVDAA